MRTRAALRSPRTSVQSTPSATPFHVAVDATAGSSNATRRLSTSAAASLAAASHAHGQLFRMNLGFFRHSPKHAQCSHSSRRSSAHGSWGCVFRAAVFGGVSAAFAVVVVGGVFDLVVVPVVPVGPVVPVVPVVPVGPVAAAAAAAVPLPAPAAAARVPPLVGALVVGPLTRVPAVSATLGAFTAPASGAGGNSNSFRTSCRRYPPSDFDSAVAARRAISSRPILATRSLVRVASSSPNAPPMTAPANPPVTFGGVTFGAVDAAPRSARCDTNNCVGEAIGQSNVLPLKR